jgi:hypothetical protein
MLSRTKMTETRLTLLPDAQFAALRPQLAGRLTATAESITPANFASLLDETMQREIQFAFRQVGATEGTIWLVEAASEALVPAYNTGPHAHKMVNQFRQPLDSGLISMVFASEQPFLENEVWQNAQQDKSLDAALNVQTHAMIAVPFYFLGACRGVVSCVILKIPGAGDPPAVRFDGMAKARVQHAATLLGRLIDYSVLQAVLGTH